MQPQTVADVHAMCNARTRAFIYGTCATLFNQRPKAAWVNKLKAANARLSDDQRFWGDRDSNVLGGLNEITGYITQILAQPEQDSALELQVDWTRLFRGVQFGYGPVPPYEALYRGEDAFEGLEAVARFYRRHGVIAKDAGNRPDYIGVELDFLCFVCEQEAQSWDKGDEIQLQEWHRAESDFVACHLGQWAPRYCDSAVEQARTGLYRGLLCLTKGWMEQAANAPRPLATDKMQNEREAM